MPSIASLSVSLTANIGTFVKNWNKASKHVEKFTEKVERSAVKVAAWTGAVISAGAAVTAYLVRRQMEALDVTGKLADQIGTTTENLIGLRHAAELAGGGSEVMDDALKQLSKRMGDLSMSKDVSAGLRKIGLSLDKLFGMDPADQFRLIAEGVKNLGTQQEKAGVATALFGKQGSDLINILDLGKDGLEEMAKDAETLGLNFSRIDAAKVEMANDAITRLHESTGALFTRLGVELSPFITIVANKLTDLGTNGAMSIDNIVGAIKDMGKALSHILDFVDLIISAAYSMQAAFHKAAGAILTASAYWGKWARMALGNMYRNTGGKMGVKYDSRSSDATFMSMIGSAGEQGQKASIADQNARAAGVSFFMGERSNRILNKITAFVDTFTDELTKARKQMEDARNAAKQKSIDQYMAQSQQEWAKNLIDGASKWVKSAYSDLMKQGAAAGLKFEWRDMAAKTTIEEASRGTFSGETAGRMVGAFTVQNKQLEQQKKMVQVLVDINENIVGGVTASVK